MLWSLLALALTAAAPSCAPSIVELGAPQAPQVVDAYIDPTSSATLGTVLELRRWIAERPGEVVVRLHWTHLGIRLDPRADRVRRWIAAMASAGHLLPALRVTQRDGVDRIFVRLGTAAGRAALAKALGVAEAEHERLAAQRCHDAQMQTARRAVRKEMGEQGTAVFRLPVFVLDELAFEDAGLLDRLRPAVGRQRSRLRARRARPPAPFPESRASSDRLIRPEVRAPALGGPGLPHTFVLMARDEDDPALYSLLPPVLAYRHAHPGTVSIRIVARGVGLEHGLRQRLCDADRKGLLPAYVQALSREPSLRNSDPATRDLLDAIDATDGGPACDLDPDDAEESLPDGGWLDGVPMTRNELQNLGGMLQLLEATDRPLDAVLRPAAPGDDV